jgi:hypothetical protein
VCACVRAWLRAACDDAAAGVAHASMSMSVEQQHALEGALALAFALGDAICTPTSGGRDAHDAQRIAGTLNQVHTSHMTTQS